MMGPHYEAQPATNQGNQAHGAIETWSQQLVTCHVAKAMEIEFKIKIKLAPLSGT